MLKFFGESAPAQSYLISQSIIISNHHAISKMSKPSEMPKPSNLSRLSEIFKLPRLRFGPWPPLLRRMRLLRRHLQILLSSLTLSSSSSWTWLGGFEITSRQFVIFEDATKRCSCSQKYPTDKYPKRIYLRNESRSCLGMSVTARPMHARITCICLIKCFFAEKSMQFK